MPALTPENRRNMLGYLSQPCSSCRGKVYKDYCRQCDYFLFVCTLGCPHNNTEHEGHRRYPKEDRAIGTSEGSCASVPSLFGMVVDVHSQEPDDGDKTTVEELLQSALRPSERGYSLRSIFYALYNLGRKRGQNDRIQSEEPPVSTR